MKCHAIEIKLEFGFYVIFKAHALNNLNNLSLNFNFIMIFGSTKPKYKQKTH